MDDIKNVNDVKELQGIGRKLSRYDEWKLHKIMGQIRKLQDDDELIDIFENTLMDNIDELNED